MNDKLDKTREELGLLANGASGRWDLAIDEALDGNEWSIEIDGPQAYLTFQLLDLRVVATALHFLKAGPLVNRSTLTLGRFVSAPVSLVWDNEDFPRCFITVGPEGQSTLRVALEAEDLKMFMEALEQLVQDLPEL